MAYESIDDESVGYDERNAEHAGQRDAANEKRDERYSDAEDVSADEQARDAAQWSEGAPACLAAVVFMQRMRRRRQAQAQDGHADGDEVGRAYPAEHI